MTTVFGEVTYPVMGMIKWQRIYESMLALYAGREDLMPQTATFGDDTPMERAVLDEVRKTVADEMRVLGVEPKLVSSLKQARAAVFWRGAQT